MPIEFKRKVVKNMKFDENCPSLKYRQWKLTSCSPVWILSGGKLPETVNLMREFQTVCDLAKKYQKVEKNEKW